MGGNAVAPKPLGRVHGRIGTPHHFLPVARGIELRDSGTDRHPDRIRFKGYF
jgi:hypothetical protein